MKKVGLVLSGGGIKGFAHLGLLQLLDEIGVQIHAISGVSAGAIVGAFYAAGYKPQQTLDMMKGNSYFGFSNFSFRRDGFFSMRQLYKSMQKYIPKDNFEDLSIKLFVTATDFSNNRSVVFSKGQLSKAVAASAALPVIFQPILYENSLLVDGGVLNNFPVEPLAQKCDCIIGSYVNKIEPSRETTGHVGKAHVFERCFNMATCANVYAKKERCALFLEPLLDQYNMLDFDKAETMFEIGYKTALRQKAKIKSIWQI